MSESPRSSKAIPLAVHADDADVVCGACLLDLFTEDCEIIGIPSGCPHLFHWDCLEKWGEVQNSCPQCKDRFRVAGKYRASDRELIECVKFKKRNRVGQGEEPSEESELPLDSCEKCKGPGNDEDFILCDGMDFTCNALFHYRCVGFTSVPAGLWFCENCIEKGFVPEEFRKKPSSPARSRKRSRTPAPRAHPITIMPRLFSRQLLVQHSANRRQSTSSRLPTNLKIDLEVPLPPVPSRPASTESVFARFRQRRLEKQFNPYSSQ
jgi:hypothetical protein